MPCRASLRGGTMICATCRDAHNKKNRFTDSATATFNHLVLAPQKDTLYLTCRIT